MTEPSTDIPGEEPARERIRRPDPATAEKLREEITEIEKELDQAAPEAPVQPGAGVPWRGPFSATGVKVTDAGGRTVCIVGEHQVPMDVRTSGAARIAAAMNSFKPTA